jgi:hypothetical protein
VSEGKSLLGLSDEGMAVMCSGLYKRVGTLFEIKVAAKA